MQQLKLRVSKHPGFSETVPAMPRGCARTKRGTAQFAAGANVSGFTQPGGRRNSPFGHSGAPARPPPC